MAFPFLVVKRRPLVFFHVFSYIYFLNVFIISLQRLQTPFFVSLKQNGRTSVTHLATFLALAEYKIGARQELLMLLQLND